MSKYSQILDNKMNADTKIKSKFNIGDLVLVSGANGWYGWNYHTMDEFIGKKYIIKAIRLHSDDVIYELEGCMNWVFAERCLSIVYKDIPDETIKQSIKDIKESMENI